MAPASAHAAAGLLALTSGLSRRPGRAGQSRATHGNAVGFTIGGFFPTRLDGARRRRRAARGPGRCSAFDINDFNSFTFGGEYLFGSATILEGGVGVGYYQKTVQSVYADLRQRQRHRDRAGSEAAASSRSPRRPVPAPRRGAAVEPYVGGGLGIFNWRYSGDRRLRRLLRQQRSSRTRYVADGTVVGPGGPRRPPRPDRRRADVGGEVRWQKAEGDTGGLDEGFLGDKIDLGGWTTSASRFRQFQVPVPDGSGPFGAGSSAEVVPRQPAE